MIDKGLYEKFNVSRTDGRSAPGEKYFGCDYFVVDINCDKFAAFVLAIYSRVCKEEYPLLAEDLEKTLEEMSESGLVMIGDDSISILKSDYIEEKREFEELDGCSCHINPPCSYCVHPGHPECLENTPEAWITVTFK